jgi:hypothetical protein
MPQMPRDELTEEQFALICDLLAQKARQGGQRHLVTNGQKVLLQGVVSTGQRQECLNIREESCRAQQRHKIRVDAFAGRVTTLEREGREGTLPALQPQRGHRVAGRDIRGKLRRFARSLALRDISGASNADPIRRRRHPSPLPPARPLG